MPPPAGLVPVSRPPAGVAIASELDNLQIDFAWAKPDPSNAAASGSATLTPRGSKIEFYLVFPPKAPLTPLLLDYELRKKDAPSSALAPKRASANPTPEETKTLSKSDEGKVVDLKKAFRINTHLILKDLGVIRFHRIVKVTLNPQTIILKGRGNYEIQNLSVRFSFPGLRNPPPLLEEYNRETWGYGKILRSFISNPEGLALYAERSRPTGDTPGFVKRPWSPSQVAPDGKWFKLQIDRDDLYRLNAKHFEEADFSPNAIDPARIRIYSRGKEVPTLLQGPASNRFTADTSLIFHAQGSDSDYSTSRTYWVRCDAPLDAPPASRITQREIPPMVEGVTKTSLHPYKIETDNQLVLLQDQFMSIEKNRWIWEQLDPAKSLKIRFDLPFFAPDSTEPQPVVLKFYLKDFKDGEDLPMKSPKITVQINDSQKTTLAAFKNTDDDSRQFLLSPKHLKPTGNEIILEIEASTKQSSTEGVVYFDNLTLRYERGLVAQNNRLEFTTRKKSPAHILLGFEEEAPFVFDITDPQAPSYTIPYEYSLSTEHKEYAIIEHRADRRYLATPVSDIPFAPAPHPYDPPTQDDLPITSPENQADYLIIYHPLFEEEIQPLVEFHTQRGLQVKTINIETIYQEYSMGDLTPQAIKDFLTDALRTWKIPPTYVLLFGDATSDYRNDLRTGLDNLVPAYTHTAGSHGRWASELWYTNHFGKDLFPDLVLGRIPAANVEDAHEMVRKVVQYSSSPAMGPWRGRFSYFADDPQEGFRFHEKAEELFQDYQPKPYNYERLFLEDFPYEDNYHFGEKHREIIIKDDMKVSTSATLKLLDVFNQGSAIMVFFGHGSPNLWCDERIWFGGDTITSDNRNLRNGPRLPFLASFTCNHGAFDYPKPSLNINISEDMMRTPQGGTIAMYLPSGPGIPQYHYRMAQDLFLAVTREKQNRIGEAVTLSRIYSLLNAANEEMVRMSVLLGDPALDLALTQETSLGQVYPPVISAYDTQPQKRRFFSLSPPPLTFRAQVSAIPAGKFVATLYDPLFKKVASSPPLLYKKGKIEWQIPLPENPIEGAWTVRAYYGNDQSKKDGQLYAPFQVTRPQIKILSFHCPKPPEKTGQKAHLELKVQNDSDLPAHNIPIDIALLPPSGPPQPKAASPAFRLSKTYDFKPHEIRTLTFTRKTKSALEYLQATAQKHTLPANPEISPVDRKTLALFQPPNTPPTLYAPPPQLIKSHWKSASALTLSFPLHHSGLAKGKARKFLLKTSTGKQLASMPYTFEGKDKNKGSIDLRFSWSTTPQNFPKTLTLILTEGPDDKATPLLEVPLLLGQPQLPDLRIQPNSIRFTPQRPTEGNTLFIHAIVENTGAAPSGKFLLDATYKSKLRGLKTIRSKPDLPQFEQPPLAAGRQRPFTLRWDHEALRDYRGRTEIVLTVDSGRKIIELNDTNNTAKSSITILSRPDIVDSFAITKNEQNPLPDATTSTLMTVTFTNQGETPAEHYRVGFFNKPPVKQSDFFDPEFLVKEIILEPVPGKKTTTLTHEWIIEKDITNPNPTAKIYRNIENLRALSQKRSAKPPEW